MAPEVIRIFPKASELNKILNKIECPEEDCSEVFHNTPNLTLHLLKTHGKNQSLKSSPYGCKTAQYYCPETGCKYSFNPDVTNETDSKFSSRFFTQFNYLKQHYIKVHLDKNFKCSKCNKGFATELHRLRHDEVCGCKYTCSCGVTYSSLESLQTHARREQHLFQREQNNRTRKRMTSEPLRSSNTRKKVESNRNEPINNHPPYSVLNVPTDVNILILHGIVSLDNSTCENNVSGAVSVSTQTDITSKRRRTLSPVKHSLNEKPVKKRTSKQTQTGEKRPKKTTETQTVQLNLISGETEKSGLKNETANSRKRKKSMETQTMNCAEQSRSSSTHSDSIHSQEFYNDSCLVAETTSTVKTNNVISSDSITEKDICFQQLWMSSESETSRKMVQDLPTQSYSTENNNISNARNDVCIEQQLNFTNNLSFYNKQQNFSSEVQKEPNTPCHIETQTDHDSSINALLGDYLSDFDTDILDQYTQTCDDIMLPDDISLDLTNNETQTAWSFCDGSFMSDVVNSETQTCGLPNLNDYVT